MKLQNKVCESLCTTNFFLLRGAHLDLRSEVDKKVTASEEVVIGFTEFAGKGSVQKAL